MGSNAVDHLITPAELKNSAEILTGWVKTLDTQLNPPPLASTVNLSTLSPTLSLSSSLPTISATNTMASTQTLTIDTPLLPADLGINSFSGSDRSILQGELNALNGIVNPLNANVMGNLDMVNIGFIQNSLGALDLRKNAMMPGGIGTPDNNDGGLFGLGNSIIFGWGEESKASRITGWRVENGRPQLVTSEVTLTKDETEAAINRKILRPGKTGDFDQMQYTGLPNGMATLQFRGDLFNLGSKDLAMNMLGARTAGVTWGTGLEVTGAVALTIIAFIPEGLLTGPGAPVVEGTEYVAAAGMWANIARGGIMIYRGIQAARFIAPAIGFISSGLSLNSAYQASNGHLAWQDAVNIGGQSFGQATLTNFAISGVGSAIGPAFTSAKPAVRFLAQAGLGEAALQTSSIVATGEPVGILNEDGSVNWEDVGMHALVLGSAGLASAAPSLASSNWAQSSNVKNFVATVGSQVALGGQTYLITGFAMETVNNLNTPIENRVAPTLESTFKNWSTGAMYGGISGTVFGGGALLSQNQTLAKLPTPVKIAGAGVIGAVAVPTFRTLTGDGSFNDNFFGQNALTNYATGGILGLGTAWGLTPTSGNSVLRFTGRGVLTPSTSPTAPLARFVYGGMVTAVADTGVNTASEYLQTGQINWNKAAINAVGDFALGGLTANYIGKQWSGITTGFKQYSLSGVAEPTNALFGKINFEPATGARLLYNQSLAGAIDWVLVSPAFTLGGSLWEGLKARTGYYGDTLTADSQRLIGNMTLNPFSWMLKKETLEEPGQSRLRLSSLTTTDLLLSAVEGPRSGLWMKPMIGLAQVKAENPTLLNVGGVGEKGLNLLRTNVQAVRNIINSVRSGEGLNVGQAFSSAVRTVTLRAANSIAGGEFQALRWFDSNIITMPGIVTGIDSGVGIIDDQLLRLTGERMPASVREVAKWVPFLMIPSYVPDARARERYEAFEVLGLKSNATYDQIRTAYRQQVKTVHPDVALANGVTDPAVLAAHEARFKQVVEAYNFLTGRGVRSTGYISGDRPVTDQPTSTPTERALVVYNPEFAQRQTGVMSSRSISALALAPQPSAPVEVAGGVVATNTPNNNTGLVRADSPVPQVVSASELPRYGLTEFRYGSNTLDGFNSGAAVPGEVHLAQTATPAIRLHEVTEALALEAGYTPDQAHILGLSAEAQAAGLSPEAQAQISADALNLSNSLGGGEVGRAAATEFVRGNPLVIDSLSSGLGRAWQPLGEVVPRPDLTGGIFPRSVGQSFGFENGVGGDGLDPTKRDLVRIEPVRVELSGRRIGDNFIVDEAVVARLVDGVWSLTPEGIARGLGIPKPRLGNAVQPAVVSQLTAEGPVRTSEVTAVRQMADGSISLRGQVSDTTVDRNRNAYGTEDSMGGGHIESLQMAEALPAEHLRFTQVHPGERDIILDFSPMCSAKDTGKVDTMSQALMAAGEDGRLLVVLRSRNQAETSGHKVRAIMEANGESGQLAVVVTADNPVSIEAGKSARIVFISEYDLEILASSNKSDFIALGNGRRAYYPEFEPDPGLQTSKVGNVPVLAEDRAAFVEADRSLTGTLGGDTATSSPTGRILTERIIQAQDGTNHTVRVIFFDQALREQVLGDRSLEQVLSTPEGTKKVNALLANGEARVEIDEVDYHLDMSTGEGRPTNPYSGVAFDVRDSDPLKALALAEVGRRKAIAAGNLSVPEARDVQYQSGMSKIIRTQVINMLFDKAHIKSLVLATGSATLDAVIRAKRVLGARTLRAAPEINLDPQMLTPARTTTVRDEAIVKTEEAAAEVHSRILGVSARGESLDRIVEGVSRAARGQVVVLVDAAGDYWRVENGERVNDPRFNSEERLSNFLQKNDNVIVIISHAYLKSVSLEASTGTDIFVLADGQARLEYTVQGSWRLRTTSFREDGRPDMTRTGDVPRRIVLINADVATLVTNQARAEREQNYSEIVENALRAQYDTLDRFGQVLPEAKAQEALRTLGEQRGQEDRHYLKTNLRGDVDVSGKASADQTVERTIRWQREEVCRVLEPFARAQAEKGDSRALDFIAELRSDTSSQKIPLGQAITPAQLRDAAAFTASELPSYTPRHIEPGVVRIAQEATTELRAALRETDPTRSAQQPITAEEFLAHEQIGVTLSNVQWLKNNGYADPGTGALYVDSPLLPSLNALSNSTPSGRAAIRTGLEVLGVGTVALPANGQLSSPQAFGVVQNLIRAVNHDNNYLPQDILSLIVLGPALGYAVAPFVALGSPLPQVTPAEFRQASTKPLGITSLVLDKLQTVHPQLVKAARPLVDAQVRIAQAQGESYRRLQLAAQAQGITDLEAAYRGLGLIGRKKIEMPVLRARWANRLHRRPDQIRLKDLGKLAEVNDTTTPPSPEDRSRYLIINGLAFAPLFVDTDSDSLVRAVEILQHSYNNSRYNYREMGSMPLSDLYQFARDFDRKDAVHERLVVVNARHKAEINRFINGALGPQTEDDKEKTIAIFGAGQMNYIDLEALARRFQYVHLIDVDDLAMAQAIVHLPEELRDKIVTRVMDLSFIRSYFMSRVRRITATSRDIETAYNKILELASDKSLLEQLARGRFRMMSNGSYDFTISDLVMHELISSLSDQMLVLGEAKFGSAWKTRFGYDGSDAKVGVSEWNQVANDLDRRVMERYIHEQARVTGERAIFAVPHRLTGLSDPTASGNLLPQDEDGHNLSLADLVSGANIGPSWETALNSNNEWPYMMQDTVEAEVTALALSKKQPEQAVSPVAATAVPSVTGAPVLSAAVNVPEGGRAVGDRVLINIRIGGQTVSILGATNGDAQAIETAINSNGGLPNGVHTINIIGEATPVPGAGVVDVGGQPLYSRRDGTLNLHRMLLDPRYNGLLIQAAIHDDGVRHNGDIREAVRDVLGDLAAMPRLEAILAAAPRVPDIQVGDRTAREDHGVLGEIPAIVLSGIEQAVTTHGQEVTNLPADLVDQLTVGFNPRIPMLRVVVIPEEMMQGYPTVLLSDNQRVAVGERTWQLLLNNRLDLGVALMHERVAQSLNLRNQAREADRRVEAQDIHNAANMTGINGSSIPAALREGSLTRPGEIRPIAGPAKKGELITNDDATRTAAEVAAAVVAAKTGNGLGQEPTPGQAGIGGGVGTGIGTGAANNIGNGGRGYNAPELLERIKPELPKAVLSGTEEVRKGMEVRIEKYNPLSFTISHFNVLVNSLKAGQFKYVLMEIFLLIFQFPIPSAEEKISKDGHVEGVTIWNGGGWTFNFPVPFIGIAALFLQAPDMAWLALTLTPILTGIAARAFLRNELTDKHELMHAYQFGLIEQAYRDGRISNAGDFIHRHYLELEFITAYDGKPITDEVLADIKTRINNMIGGPVVVAGQAELAQAPVSPLAIPAPLPVPPKLPTPQQSPLDERSPALPLTPGQNTGTSTNNGVPGANNGGGSRVAAASTGLGNQAAGGIIKPLMLFRDKLFIGVIPQIRLKVLGLVGGTVTAHGPPAVSTTGSLPESARRDANTEGKLVSVSGANEVTSEANAVGSIVSLAGAQRATSRDGGEGQDAESVSGNRSNTAVEAVSNTDSRVVPGNNIGNGVARETGRITGSRSASAEESNRVGARVLVVRINEFVVSSVAAAASRLRNTGLSPFRTAGAAEISQTPGSTRASGVSRDFGKIFEAEGSMLGTEEPSETEPSTSAAQVTPIDRLENNPANLTDREGNMLGTEEPSETEPSTSAAQVTPIDRLENNPANLTDREGSMLGPQSSGILGNSQYPLSALVDATVQYCEEKGITIIGIGERAHRALALIYMFIPYMLPAFAKIGYRQLVIEFLFRNTESELESVYEILEKHSSDSREEKIALLRHIILEDASRFPGLNYNCRRLDKPQSAYKSDVLLLLIVTAQELGVKLYGMVNPN